jgi:predicted phosphodiesterase
MKRTKYKELLLLILVAILFFIIGNMSNQLNLYAYLKRLFSRPLNSQVVEKSTDVSFYETQYETDEISLLSLNKDMLLESEKPLKFLVAGHIFGDPYDDNLIQPAMTLQKNLQTFNQMDLDMIVLLGDIIKNSTEENFNHFTNFFLEVIQIPVFNAVGNHDVEKRDLYTKKFGETNFSFIYKDHLFIFLDTNIETFTLTDNQFNYIENTIIESLDRKSLKSIHIFVHHVIFYKSPAIAFPSKFQPNVNYSMKKNVEKFIINILDPVSDLVPVFIYAGDVGAGAQCGNLSPYYDYFKNTNVITIATGIGNCEEDSVLIVQETNNEIYIEPYSLVGKEMLPIETYNTEYWKKK